MAGGGGWEEGGMEGGTGGGGRRGMWSWGIGNITFSVILIKKKKFIYR